MKKLLLLILFSSHFASAEDTSNHSPRMPPKAELMVKAFPHTFYATLACFNYPKINIKACEQIAEVDHPGSAYARERCKGGHYHHVYFRKLKRRHSHEKTITTYSHLLTFSLG